MKRLLLGALGGLLLSSAVFAAGTTVNVGGGGGSGSGSLFATVTNRPPVNGSDACSTGDTWQDTAAHQMWACEVGATDTWNKTTQVLQEIEFALPAPAVALAKLPIRITRAMVPPSSGTGSTLSCVSRGGTYAASMILRGQECTSIAGGVSTCADITGNLTLTAADTPATAAYTDSAWAAGSYLQMNITQDSTTPPTWVSCQVVGLTN